MSTANRTVFGTYSSNNVWQEHETEWRPSGHVEVSTQVFSDPYSVLIPARYTRTPEGGQIEAFVDATAIRKRIAIRKINDLIEGFTPRSNTGPNAGK